MHAMQFMHTHQRLTVVSLYGSDVLGCRDQADI